MTRGTAIGWLATLGMHAAVLFGVQPLRELPPVSPPDEPTMEVALYEPPPPPAPAIPEPVPEPPPPPVAPPASPPEPVPMPEPTAPEPPPPTVVEPVKPEPEPKREPPPPPQPKPESKPASRPKAAPVTPRPAPSRPAEPRTSGSGSPNKAPDARRTVTPPGYQNVGSVSYVRRGRASYPADALRKKQTGTVQLMLYINETGSVDRVEVVGSSGFPALDAAAAAAEKKSRFRPAVKNGVPVKAKARVPYTFQLK